MGTQQTEAPECAAVCRGGPYHGKHIESGTRSTLQFSVFARGRVWNGHYLYSDSDGEFVWRGTDSAE